MARYLGSHCKVCRQLNFSVCGSARCALARRNTPPGMHSQLRRKVSEFKKRLIEKQKLRFSCWVSEKQLRNYVKEAFKKTGIPGETLISLLERRLDNFIYRLGFAPTLLTARITQKALNNTARHSKANFVSLSLTKKDGSIDLVIRDNGRGFDMETVLSVGSPQRSFGLSSMKERAALSGGSFDIKSASGKGTTIHVSWPSA